MPSDDFMLNFKSKEDNRTCFSFVLDLYLTPTSKQAPGFEFRTQAPL